MLAILGFDTATDRTVVAATRGEETVFSFSDRPEPGERPAHSAELLPAIERGLEALGGWAEVDLVAVGRGPGTFTGLRIAIATARGVALSGAARVVGVSTLEALARPLSTAAGSVAVPLLDARRGEVFFGAWEEGGANLIPPSVATPGEAARAVLSLGRDAVAAGPGAIRFRSELSDFGLETVDPDSPENQLDGTILCTLAGETGSDEAPIEPIYLRAPDAERWTAQPPPGG